MIADHYNHVALTQLVLFLKQASPFRGLHCSGVLKVHFCKSPEGDPAVHATVGKIHQHYPNKHSEMYNICALLFVGCCGTSPIEAGVLFVRCPHFRHEMGQMLIERFH